MRGLAIMRGALARIVLAVGLVALFAAGVEATPPSGINSAPFLGRAAVQGAIDMKLKIPTGAGTNVIHMPDLDDVAVQSVSIAPGGHTGWHSHPGSVIVLVNAGEFSYYASDDPECSRRVYTAGQSFVDPGQGFVHIGRNEGTVNLEILAVYLDVPSGAPVRTDAANPGNCPF